MYEFHFSITRHAATLCILTMRTHNTYGRIFKNIKEKTMLFTSPPFIKKSVHASNSKIYLKRNVMRKSTKVVRNWFIDVELENDVFYVVA